MSKLRDRIGKLVARKIVTFEPSGLRIYANAAVTILDAAHSLGLHIASECGGRGTCGKCQVTIQPSPKPTELDTAHISESDIKRGVRLACQHGIHEHLHVSIDYHSSQTKILINGIKSATKLELDEGLEKQVGIAIDLGTTTIVAYLLDLAKGIQIGHAAALNPQIIFGEDVMSRIAYAQQEANGGKRLKEAALKKIDELIIELSSIASVDIQKITRLAVVGNPAMHHLLLGLDTSSLGRAPYEPVIKDALNKRGRELGLSTTTKSQVYLAPNIAGFVGGDTAAFILSQRLDEVDGIILGIDIGTNGEIILSVSGQLYCCSAAAGSAFEGATIKHGMRGQEGAIEHLSIEDLNEAPRISVIGNVPPRGICGSGIVDIVAELKASDVVMSSGKMQESDRVIHSNGEKAYVITHPGEHDSKQLLVFTQKDVRQVQLAKGAILAGAAILMESAGIGIKEIEAVLLAGAFGNYIDPKQALAIGLLPPVGIEKIIPVGNAAGEGAKRLLLSMSERALIEKVVRRISYVELATYADFARVFANATILDGKMPL
jgi:uncharacterized 2Fe-2S/4Fe-4S cluster protein (DUF4445 family)